MIKVLESRTRLTWTNVLFSGGGFGLAAFRSRSQVRRTEKDDNPECASRDQRLALHHPDPVVRQRNPTAMGHTDTSRPARRHTNQLISWSTATAIRGRPLIPVRLIDPTRPAVPDWRFQPLMRSSPGARTPPEAELCMPIVLSESDSATKTT